MVKLLEEFIDGLKLILKFPNKLFDGSYHNPPTLGEPKIWLNISKDVSFWQTVKLLSSPAFPDIIQQLVVPLPPVWENVILQFWLE